MKPDPDPEREPGDESADSTRIVIKDTADIIAAVPYLVGHHPEDSLVVLGIRENTIATVIRADLPPADDMDTTATVASWIAQWAARNDLAGLFLVGYGAEAEALPPLAAVASVLGERRVDVLNAIHVADDQRWSSLREDPGTHSFEGGPVDVSTTAIAAQATFVGKVALASRAELEQCVAEITGATRDAMRLATTRAEARFLGGLMETSRPGAFRAQLVAEGLPFVVDLLGRERAQGITMTDDEAAWLGILLTDLRLRDEAWVRIDRDQPHSDIEFWRYVTRRMEPAYVAAPACLLAFAAFMAGDGALANVALDRADAAKPDYSLSELLRTIITCGLPPDRLKRMSAPDELAASYGELDQQKSVDDDPAS